MTEQSALGKYPTVSHSPDGESTWPDATGSPPCSLQVSTDELSNGRSTQAPLALIPPRKFERSLGFLVDAPSTQLHRAPTPLDPLLLPQRQHVCSYAPPRTGLLTDPRPRSLCPTGAQAPRDPWPGRDLRCGYVTFFDSGRRGLSGSLRSAREASVAGTASCGRRQRTRNGGGTDANGSTQCSTPTRTLPCRTSRPRSRPCLATVSARCARSSTPKRASPSLSPALGPLAGS